MKRKYIFIQNDSNTCGICVISSILSFYNGFVPSNKIRKDIHLQKDGTNALMIINALKQYGFTSYGIKSTLFNLDKKLLPIIAHVVKEGYEHFVVIFEIKKDKVITMDPEFGKKVYNIDDFNKIFDNVVIVSKPNNKILNIKKNNTLYVYFKRFIYKNRLALIKIYSLSMIAILLSIIINLYLKFLEKSENRFSLTFIFVFILIAFIIISIYRELKEAKLINSLYKKTNNELIRHIFYIKQESLNTFKTGELIDKINSILEINNLFIKFILAGINSLILFICCMCIINNVSNILFRISLIILLIYLITYLIISKKLYILESNNIITKNRYYGRLNEFLNGIESIKNINKLDLFKNILKKEFSNTLDNDYKLFRFNILNKNFINFILELGTIVINFIGFNLVYKGSISFVELLTLNTLFSLGFSGYTEVLSIFSDILHIKALFNSSSEFLDIEEESKNDYKIEYFSNISINNLTYSYDYVHTVLNNININIKKNDKILINGKSGVGKSTFIKCIVGIIDDYKGIIKLNNIDLKSISVNEIRRHITYIGQNEVLYNDTIKNNICLDEYDELSYKKIIDILRLDEIFNKRLEKDNTYILENGDNFSKGEKARIILARALYRNTSIIIIDETLSSISEEKENEILNKLLKLDYLTIIYISHRNKRNMFNKIIDL